MKISAYTGQVSDAGTEQMTVSTPTKTVVVVRANLSGPNQTTYNNFIVILTNDSSVTIDNNPYNMDIDRVTSDAVAQNESVIDYNALSTANKTIITAFSNLINAL